MRVRTPAMIGKRPSITRVAAAVCVALYGSPRSTLADPPDTAEPVLQEVTVTATRRQTSIDRPLRGGNRPHHPGHQCYRQPRSRLSHL